MIRRRRAAVGRPKAFDARVRAALADLRKFAKIEKRERGQLRFSFDPSLWQDDALRGALLELFGRKCAYCESELTEATLIVDRFRPEQEAMSLDGRVEDPDLYWWLAYEWTNLYPACGECREGKSTRFPVTGPRARPEARGTALRAERRLLLDPCDDEPEAELHFAADGTVEGLSERGAVSVNVYWLNRPSLVERRRQVAAELLDRLDRLDGHGVRAQQKTLALADEPFTALRRALIQERLGAPPSAAAPERKVTPAPLTPVWLQHVEIHNFRSLRHLELAFPAHTSDRAPWLLLLGVNGVGKSSVLQAITLAFMREGERRKYVANASQLVTRQQPEPGGNVRLTFNDGSTTTLRFRRGERSFTLEGRPPPMNVYAYGSTRLPPVAGDGHSHRPHLHRLNNLFDPRYPLTLAERWMADVERVPSRTFTFLASSLRLLLELEEDDRIVRSRGALRIRQGGDELPLAEYSDGYRSIVAFTTDLMLNLSERWDSIRAAEGLVLVDELEVHLHPTWRMTAVERLRTVFPRLRFVATTHDPLCLRGSLPGEVHVLVRDDETRVVEARQRDIPPGLTADELLTGGWFGMATTLDEDTTKLMLEHGKLLLEPTTPENDTRRAQIEEQLRERRGTFAETGDERLVRSVLAELRGDQPSLSDEQRKSAKQAILERVQAQKDGAP